MPFSLDLCASNDLLRLRHFGDVSIEEINRAVESIREQFGEKPASRFLLDLSAVQSGPNRSECLDWLQGKGPVFSVNKTAVLGSESTADEVEFLALVAQNRGHVAWDFLDENKAMEWLLRNPGDY